MCKFFFLHRVTPFYKYHLNLCPCQGLSLFKKEPLFSPFDLTPQTTEICLPPGHCFETVHIKVSKIHLVARNSFISVFDIPQLAVSPLFHPRFLVLLLLSLKLAFPLVSTPFSLSISSYCPSGRPHILNTYHLCAGESQIRPPSLKHL